MHRNEGCACHGAWVGLLVLGCNKLVPKGVIS
jgi:hypothetical protein